MREDHHLDQIYDYTCHRDQDISTSSTNALRSSVGIVYYRHLCGRCLKPEDTKHPERNGKLLLISYTAVWSVFRSHNIMLQDDAMRGRITRLIDSTTDSF